MVIRIESLEVENFYSFRGEHRLDLSQIENSGIDIITGQNDTGKTTLANSIHLCLTGEFEVDSPLVTYDLIDELSPGEEVTGKVITTIFDSELDQRFRFSRKFYTLETRRGPVNYVDPLQAQEKNDGEWVDVGCTEAVNTVFPTPAFTFSNLDPESSLGIKDIWGGTSWSEIVEDLRDAATQQAAARNIELPEYYSNDNDLGDEMLRRINDLLTTVDSRYRIDKKQDNLVIKKADVEYGGEIHSAPMGQQILITQITALIAGEMMPAPTPLIGDTIFGRVISETRKQVAQVIQEADRQVLLFALEIELEGLDLFPQFKLEMADQESQITSLQ